MYESWTIKLIDESEFYSDGHYLPSWILSVPVWLKIHNGNFRSAAGEYGTSIFFVINKVIRNILFIKRCKRVIKKEYCLKTI